MANRQLSMFLRRLRRVVLLSSAGGPSDSELLQRFIQGRDEEAFELLVWRHGAMVLNVCRRVLRREHDAEDAFQATFLTLVRKAGAIGKREAVGSWLYKVAYRIALRARGAASSRPLPEGPLPDPSSTEPIDDLLWREFGAAMDEEIHRLPNRYQAAVVLCHLEGQTIESAARTLDCPPGTVGTWLARGRELLRRRLARRGFDVSSVVGAKNIVAALSAALVNSTVQAALLGTAERAAAAGVISASVAALTKGALQAMTLTRWAATTAVVLTLSLLGGGSAVVAHRVLAVEPARTASVRDHRRSSVGERSRAAVLFQWKFKKGQPFYQIVTTKTTQVMKVMNNDVTQNQEQTFYIQWTPEKKVDGKWIIAWKILGVKMDIDIGGVPIKYDSTQKQKQTFHFRWTPEKKVDGKSILALKILGVRIEIDIGGASNPLDEFFKSLVGAEFKLVLDAETLEILRIDGREKFVNKSVAANKQMKPLLDKILSEDALREMAEPSFASLLMGPARPGDSWTKMHQRDMGPIGAFETTSRCTYVGVKDGLDKINVISSLKYLPYAKKDGIGGLPFVIRKADMSGKGSGVLRFDRVKGRLARTELNMKLAGTLGIEIGGQPTQVKLSQTQQTTVQTMDTNPLGVKRLRAENERLRMENERLERRLRAVEEALRREDKPK
jgi:RNA polymerase sigma factor (sigma-70 family)